MKKLLAFFLLFSTSSWCASRFAQTPEGTVQLVIEKPIQSNSERAKIGFYFELKPQWHIYWRNPGDSGLPPKVEWLDGKESFDFSDFIWPTPKRISMNVLANYGYEGEILLPLYASPKKPLSAGQKITAKISWLVCKEECIPREATLEIDPTKKSDISINFNPKVPTKLDSWKWKKISLSDQALTAELEIPFAKEKLSADTIDYFPFASGLVKTIDKPRMKWLGSNGGKSTLSLSFTARPAAGKNKVQSFDGVLFLNPEEAYELSSEKRIQDAEERSVTAVPAQADQEYSLALLLLLAFIGGVLLNFMPCVFPILAIKIFDFSHRKSNNQKELKIQSYFYVLGVLLSFWILASLIFVFRSQGTMLGWGFQLQSSTFIVILSALFTLLALNFWGLFEVHLPFISKAASLRIQEGRLGAVMSGFLTTIVSTPCTAPFLGAALGAALALPPMKSFSIFTFMALGVSLPYVALIHATFLRAMLPKPGAWMEQLKHFLGFFMIATVIWLFSVLGKQNNLASVIWAMSGLLILAITVWWKGVAKFVVKLVLFLMAITSLWMATVPAKQKASWQEFDPAKLELLAKDHIVFVDFTASWCLTCQVNKAVAIETKQVQEVFEKYDVVLVRADWTNQDETITKELAKYGRSSVPTDVILGPGAEKPTVLPTLLTSTTVVDAIKSRVKK